MSYLNEIVDYINADPSTGCSRYVPEQTASSSGNHSEPFTSGGRYIPEHSVVNTSFGGGDSYTSGGRYVPSQSASDLLPNASLPVDKKKPTSELVPIKDLILFSDKADQKAIDALKKANSEVSAEFELEEPSVDGRSSPSPNPSGANTALLRRIAQIIQPLQNELKQKFDEERKQRLEERRQDDEQRKIDERTKKCVLLCVVVCAFVGIFIIWFWKFNRKSFGF
ncbi:unnamed protein product [Bursaphelenchus okinawaensis]|uniref:Uncharacterized protein n=1 Tax=Bursaphelenchus okinawaensis TaxID=465554 RepID=A0A811KCU7_9BILA|nr:unnamed protein product [Bursaphelenchus okinawaensis]CAG9099356.1 unnamed protein product [Bursaphelenchus okinawaensis]